MSSRPRWAAASFLLAIPLGADSLTQAAPRQSVAHAFSIPGQPLELALQEFAQQSGIQIVFLASVTKGKQAPALVGTYTLEESLGTLLESSALRYRRISAHAVEIYSGTPRPERRRALTAITPDESATLAEVVIHGVAEGVVATRTETPLRDIPQTVSIVSLVQIHEQNLHDLSEGRKPSTAHRESRPSATTQWTKTT